MTTMTTTRWRFKLTGRSVSVRLDSDAESVWVGNVGLVKRKHFFDQYECLETSAELLSKAKDIVVNLMKLRPTVERAYVAHGEFHMLWTMDRGRPDYDKNEWTSLYNMLGKFTTDLYGAGWISRVRERGQSQGNEIVPPAEHKCLFRGELALHTPPTYDELREQILGTTYDARQQDCYNLIQLIDTLRAEMTDRIRELGASSSLTSANCYRCNKPIGNREFVRSKEHASVVWHRSCE